MVIALLPKSSSAEGFGGFLQWAPGIILIFGFVLLKGGGELAGRGSNPVTLVAPEFFVRRVSGLMDVTLPGRQRPQLQNPRPLHSSSL